MERQSHFANRIVAVIVSVVVAITFSFLVYLIFHIRTVLNRQLASEGLSLVQSISQSSELGTITGESTFLNQAFTIAMDNQKTVFIAAYDSQGKIIHESSRSSMDLDLPQSVVADLKKIKAPFAGDMAKLTDGRIDDFFAPVTTAGGDEYFFEEPGKEVQPLRTIGLIRIGMSRSFIQQVLNQSISVALIIACVMIAIGIFLAFVLSRRITKPLKELEAGTKSIAEGNMNFELPVKSRDEVGSLAKSFNTMVKALQETTVSRDYYDGILRSMNDMLIVTDGTGYVKSVNEQTLRLLGYRNEDVIGRQVGDLFDRQAAKFEENIWKPLIQKGELTDRESMAQRHDGTCFYVAISGSTLKGVKGSGGEVIFNARDISERKRAEDTMKEANRELLHLYHTRSEFISMISHELRTPLSSIKAAIDIVLRGIDGPLSEGQNETLGIAKQNVDRLARLIGNILDFTKLESGKLELNYEKADMNRLVLEVTSFMRPGMDKKALVFSLDMPPEPIIATCDTDKIRQVLINLLDNAIKFTESNGKIFVRLMHADGSVKIQIEDTGIGIREEEKSRIFELFGQISHGGIWKTGGVGLGLTICKQIMEQHRGKISVDSVYGNGSTFTITFPSYPKALS